MQRDMNLIRALLLAIESSPTSKLASQPTIKGWDTATVSHHIELSVMQRLILAKRFDYVGQKLPEWHAIQLTPQGYDFLEAARDDTIWTKMKTTLGPLFRTASIAAIQQALNDIATGKIKLP